MYLGSPRYPEEVRADPLARWIAAGMGVEGLLAVKRLLTRSGDVPPGPTKVARPTVIANLPGAA